MKVFTVFLLAINVITMGCLVAGARMELPAWKEYFKEAKSAVSSFEASGDPMQKWMTKVYSAHLERAESAAATVIAEYKRADVPCGLLAILNILGLSILALKRNNPQQSCSNTKGAVST